MNINAFLNSLLVSETNSLSVLDIALTITIPFVLTLFIALFYRKASRSSHYSLSFVYSLMLFSSLTAIITLLIGSNIARAFGLVGALSLIRFRTAVKSPLDAVYLFWSLAVGMACGTGFYLAASIIVALGTLYNYLLILTRFGESNKSFCILKMSFSNKPDLDPQKLLEKERISGFSVLKKLNFFFNSSEKTRIYTYSIELKNDEDFEDINEKIQKIEGVSKSEILNTESALFI